MRLIPFTPVVSAASAYTAGDVVGTKVNLGRIDAVLKSISITDDGNQGAAGQIIFFDGDPGAVPADNAAFTWPTGARAKVIGVVDMPTFKTVASKKIGVVSNIDLALKSNQLHAVFVTSGTPTYVSTSDLNIRFGFENQY